MGCPSSAKTCTELHRPSATPRCSRELPKHLGEASPILLQKHGLYIYLIMVGTITQHLSVGEDGHYQMVLQPKPCTDPAPPSPRGRRASSDSLHLSLLSEVKLCLSTFRSGASRQKQLAEDSTISLSWNLKVYF